MMTEIETIDGGQKMLSLGGPTLKKLYVRRFFRRRTKTSQIRKLLACSDKQLTECKTLFS